MAERQFDRRVVDAALGAPRAERAAEPVDGAESEPAREGRQGAVAHHASQEGGK